MRISRIPYNFDVLLEFVSSKYDKEPVCKLLRVNRKVEFHCFSQWSAQNLDLWHKYDHVRDLILCDLLQTFLSRGGFSSSHLQIGRANPASYQMNTVKSLTGLKRLGHGAHHSHLTTFEYWNASSHTFIPLPISSSWPETWYHRDNATFLPFT
jgi:hypothetical protein